MFTQVSYVEASTAKTVRPAVAKQACAECNENSREAEIQIWGRGGQRQGQAECTAWETLIDVGTAGEREGGGSGEAGRPGASTSAFLELHTGWRGPRLLALTHTCVSSSL